MTDRFRLFQTATALLYLGPLLAGLSGQGWAMVPVFSAIFVLWSVILRPHLWPARPGDLIRPEALVALLSLLATQILLVTLCFALGRGIGGVMGLHGVLPAYLPAALSFLSVPLSRLVWNPDQTEALTGFDPLRHRPADPAPEDRTQTLLAEILSLPDDVEEDELQARLSAIGLDALVIRRTLQEAALDPRFTRAGMKALIVHATDPEVAGLLSGSAYPAQVFDLLGAEDEVMTLFATRCARVVEDDPQLAADCPSPAAVIAAAGPDAASGTALMRLAGLLQDAQPGTL
jgi:hypothetical protein